MYHEHGLNWPLGLLAMAVVIAVMGAGLYDYAYAQGPTVNYSEHPVAYTTADDVLRWSLNLEATAPPGLEDFYDADYYGPAQIYCTNGYDFDIWIVTKDGAVTVPAGGHFVLTKKGE